MKTFLLLLSLLGSMAVHADTTIAPANPYAYSANAGWINFTANTTHGVVVTESYLSGYAYAANFGWIHLGDGTPDNGHSYANTSASDYGVNMDTQGRLTGYAYAANVGWINFEQTQGMPKLDFLTGKFTGYAWGANIGWISLDTTTSDLVTTTMSCPDTDEDGIGDAWEMAWFESLEKAGMETDLDGDCQSDQAEFLAGTNPLDSTSQLRITAHSYSSGMFSTATLTFTSVPNRLYSIEASTTLQAPWTNSAFGTFAPDTGATTNKTIIHGGGSRHFFRVVAHKPLQP